MNNKTKPQQQELIVTIRRHPITGFGWEISPDASPDKTPIVCGFDTLQEMFSSLEFIRILQKNLGPDSVPEHVVKYVEWLETQNTFKFTDDLVAEIETMFGVKATRTNKPE